LFRPKIGRHAWIGSPDAAAIFFAARDMRHPSVATRAEAASMIRPNFPDRRRARVSAAHATPRSLDISASQLARHGAAAAGTPPRRPSSNGSSPPLLRYQYIDVPRGPSPHPLTPRDLRSPPPFPCDTTSRLRAYRRRCGRVRDRTRYGAAGEPQGQLGRQTLGFARPDRRLDQKKT